MYHRARSSTLDTGNKERDIGFTTSSNLKPAQKCKKAAQTASTVLAQITRAFHFRDRHVFLSLYQQYVRAAPPEVFHGCLVTLDPGGHLVPEAVQQRPVRAISGLRATTYEEKLKELMMPSLQERRNEIDMVQTYKIVMGIDMVNCDLWFERAGKRRPTRNNIVRHNLVPRRSNHEYRRKFFSSRVVDRWNNLPT